MLKMIWFFVGVLTPLLRPAFSLFRVGQFLLMEEAGVPGENHRPSIGNVESDSRIEYNI